MMKLMKLGLGRKVRNFTLVTTAVQCLMSGTIAYGADSQPHDFVPAPAGTQIGLLYYLGSTSDTYIDGHGHEVDDSSLDTNVGLLRYVYYFDIAGMRADVNVLQPFGSLNNMRVGVATSTPKTSPSGMLRWSVRSGR
ncbi:hypothetical protein KMZ27_28040 [Pseudomonas shirazica]|nr:hypothetical protein [Pseudomonas shirazica]